MSLSGRLGRALTFASRFAADARVVVQTARSRGARRPRLAACADPSLWVAGLIRTQSLFRTTLGGSLGTSAILRVVFHVDVWTDDVGGGLRLPHPFGIVIGEGVSLGEGCTLMHNVTMQRSRATKIGDGVVLGTGSVVLAEANIGAGSVIGAASVVRGTVPMRSVAVGQPARVVRAVRPGESGID